VQNSVWDVALLAAVQLVSGGRRCPLEIQAVAKRRTADAATGAATKGGGWRPNRSARVEAVRRDETQERLHRSPSSH
jgi:hypothetical protein